MPEMRTHPYLSLLWMITLALASCAAKTTPSTVASEIPTLAPPTVTAVPLAAMVNGDPILLSDYETELERAKAARGIELATDELDGGLVLKRLIDRRLLAQAAHAQGMMIENIAIDEKLQALSSELGQAGLQSWMQENYYTADSLRSALEEEMLAGKMVKRLIEIVPDKALHAHARHILVGSQAEAEQIHAQLLAGADFAEVAQLASLDPSTRPAGGDLGWFPQGTLTQPALEEMIFSLQPGQISDVVSSALGYHIAQLIELEQRPLPRQALIEKQRQAVEEWLASEWDNSQIQIFIALE